jgi:hypothetical protein
MDLLSKWVRREKMNLRKPLCGIKTIAATLAVSMTLLMPCLAVAEDMEPVTVVTFNRAESDVAIKNVYDKFGLSTFFHYRAPVAIDKQPVIRMNRDTLYSSAVLDLSKPAVVTMPEADGRYMSLHVINQDHYSFAKIKPGRYELTQDVVGSRYAYLIVRTFIDANDPKDVAAANKLQDTLKIEGGGTGTLDIPDWDMEQLLIARGALNTLAKLGASNVGAFGKKEETDPINHLVFTAAGWGGLPLKHTFGKLGTVENNDGTPHVLTVKDAPVRAFWSVIVYNADGFIPENSMGVYSYNNVTAKANDDSSITIHFGGCEDGRKNCLPISEGWNYVIRMYEPEQEILDGSWKFPAIKPVN